jgi:hypothetical protein
MNSYDMMTEVVNYYLILTGDKIIVYNNLHTNEKYSDRLQIFTDNHLELKVKYGYYNFLFEKLWVISHVHSWEWYSTCKPHIEDFSELLKKISRIFEYSWNRESSSHTYTDRMEVNVKEWGFCLSRGICFFIFVCAVTIRIYYNITILINKIIWIDVKKLIWGIINLYIYIK